MGLINKMPTDVQSISSVLIGCIFLWRSIASNGLYIFYCSLLYSSQIKKIEQFQPCTWDLASPLTEEHVEFTCSSKNKEPNFLPNKLIFTVSQPKALEICDVILREEKVDKVTLNAGKLHGVVDGQYDVYKPDVADDKVNSNATNDSKIGQIEVMEENIHALKSFAKVLEKDVQGKIKVCSVRFKGRLNLQLLYTPCKIKVYGSAVRCVI